MDVKLRCNSIRGSVQGDKIATERTFVSTDVDGSQLNPDVNFANYQDSKIGDTSDTSIKLNDVVTFTIGTPV